MIHPSTIKFLKDLKKNNDKSWFDANRKTYDAAKADFIAFVDALIKDMSTFDSSLSELTAKNCIFRINRDVRFSKDKSPYKTNMGASINKGGKKVSDAGYYFHLEPGQSFIAGGCYMPEPEDLNNIRQEIDYGFEEWKTIINNKTFKKYFPNGIESPGTLVRPPKGYDESNPAIEFIKMKGFIVSCPISDAALTDQKNFKAIIKTFEAIKPLVDFMNKAMG
ncbi:DUF2461 domain-containing protein [Ferruginibacter lapsinanis]|uniref:DUF2461 domain-containing protein n=1 Tax=Ferruginibacter lapsinanis TaxID=563172 RepID=UPI001E2EA216|nr:DUF2461 domain-containing protein [Ferruginibacter lapsinanis]UEG50630.1 DUF2461 domain-containing protein [Ferruginibacter lapsinanis]